MRKFYAIDFDGTIVENKWPEIGKPKRKVIRKMKRLYKQGHCIIIWTCRNGERLEQAIKYLKDSSIPFHYVNENPENPYGDENRKIFAHEYWDDKAIRIK